MGRKFTYRDSEGAYHVTARVNNKEIYPISMKDCWNLYNYFLVKLEEKYNFRIHSFVLMPNHFHLIVSTPDSNIDSGMNYFMCATSKGIGLAANRINHLYGGSYFASYINDPMYFAVAFKYVYRNPVRANFCSNVTDYDWSSLNTETKFKIHRHLMDDLVPPLFDDQIEWLNFSNNFNESILKESFKKKKFKNPIDRSRRKPINMAQYISDNAVLLPKVRSAFGSEGVSSG